MITRVAQLFRIRKILHVERYKMCVALLDVINGTGDENEQAEQAGTAFPLICYSSVTLLPYQLAPWSTAFSCAFLKSMKGHYAMPILPCLVFGVLGFLVFQTSHNFFRSFSGN